MFNYYTWVYKQLIGIGLFLLMCAHMRYERERGQLRWEKWKSGERNFTSWVLLLLWIKQTCGLYNFWVKVEF